MMNGRKLLDEYKKEMTTDKYNEFQNLAYNRIQR